MKIIKIIDLLFHALNIYINILQVIANLYVLEVLTDRNAAQTEENKQVLRSCGAMLPPTGQNLKLFKVKKKKKKSE